MKALKSAKRICAQCLMELIYILIDLSPSMDETDFVPSRRQGAIVAIKQLISTKAKLYPEDQIGIIGFAKKAYLIHDCVRSGEGSKSLFQSLDKCPDDCEWTNFVAALREAQLMMFPASRTKVKNKLFQWCSDLVFDPSAQDTNDNITRRIIFLSDGEHNQKGDPVPIAEQLKTAGVTIDCIGIGGSPGDVDAKMLKAIASPDENGKPRYWFINDTQGLIRKYESMAHHIRPV